MTALPVSFYWLLAQRLPGMTARALRRLARAEPDPAVWLQWSAARLGGRRIAEPTVAAIVDWQRRGSASLAAQAALRDLEWLDRSAAQLLPMVDADYPALLLEIADPPPLLYVWGDSARLAAPQLAVVGSRRPTRQGVADAGLFAGPLARAGFAITSGLALGIDAAAHRAALDAGGTTIAVMGTGLDRIYPVANTDLAQAIRASGALVTEFPLGTPPRAAHFPSRNRIISGLSLGTLVIEAAPQSGSLVTARLALEQNREVYALPGSIHNPMSRGCNALIRSGATLVQDAADILDELLGWRGPAGAPAAAEPAPALPPLGDDERRVYAAIGGEAVTLDNLLEVVALPVPTLLSILAELELLGLIESRGGSYLRALPEPAAAV